jgi:hypothetical protein
MGCTTPRAIYFGSPGYLTTIDYPREGIIADRTRSIAEFALDAGGERATFMPGGRRRYTLVWDALTSTSWYTLWGYYHGHNGQGPFVIINPGTINFLTVNQSSGTSETNDTSGFTVAGTGGVIASQTTTVYQGLRALSWTFGTATPGVSTLTLNTPSTDWTGIPVYPALTYSFSVQIKQYAVGAVTLTAEILWYKADGTASTTPSSSGASLASSGAWQQLYVSAAAPADAAFALCRVEATSASIALNESVALDAFQFEISAAPTIWTPGSGILPVVMVTLTGDHQMYRSSTNRLGPTLVLQEVGG